MADSFGLHPLTGHREFDRLITDLSGLQDPEQIESAQHRIWERFGVEGAVFISDMAGFSKTTRKAGVCHFLRMIQRARETMAPVIAANRGTLIKCDADNCYAYFATADDAIEASFAVNAAIHAVNEAVGLGARGLQRRRNHVQPLP